MWKEEYIKRIKEFGNFPIIIILFETFFNIPVTIMLSFLSEEFLFFVLFHLVITMLLIIKAIDYKKGENCSFLKRYSYILEELADGFDNPIFENEYVIISNKGLASKRYIKCVVKLTDILAIYNTEGRRHYYSGKNFIKIKTINGKTLDVCYISIYDKKTCLDLISTIVKYCPNAKIGNSKEVMDYVKEKMQEYKLENGIISDK